MGAPVGSLANMTFRYQGTVDFRRLYQEGKEFFTMRTDILEFIEKKHKEKDDEIEVAWAINQNYDIYNQLKYEIEIKLQDKRDITVVQNGVERQLQEGKLRVYIRAGYETNYGNQTPAGTSVLFEPKKDGKDTWLHKLYKTVTARDRSDLVEDIAAITATEFLELVKSICNVDARN